MQYCRALLLKAISPYIGNNHIIGAHVNAVDETCNNGLITRTPKTSIDFLIALLLVSDKYHSSLQNEYGKYVEDYSVTAISYYVTFHFQRKAAYLVY